MSRTICILGINGGIGGEIARTMRRRGWHVRALVRDRGAALARWPKAGLTWIEGDALDQGAVIRAASGAEAIVHAVNPPGYRGWGQVVLPMIDNTLAAARASGGARIVLPGTIYNFDPASTAVIRADSPQEPRGSKGLIRVEMERRLERAAGDCPALILRAGDFFGPDAGSSWFSQAMVTPGKPVRRLINPAKGIGHSWAYLPDLAETFGQLLERSDQLKAFERLQFEGLWDRDGSSMPQAIRAVIHRHVPEYRFPWRLMRLLAPFGGFPAAVSDVGPFWQHPIRLDNGRLTALLGSEPRTPLEVAVRVTLARLGCLDGA